MALTKLAHQLIREHFKHQPKLFAVDATLGNGNDYEFLIRLGFEVVHGFDLQDRALKITRHRLIEAGLKEHSLHRVNHANMSRFIDQKIDCCMFNFGYLPNGDKSITTKTQSSLDAIEFVLRNLSHKGFLSLMCYPGHLEGKPETAAIDRRIKALSEDFLYNIIESSTPTDTSPILYTVKRL